MKNSSKLILIFAIVLMVIVMVIVIGIEGWYIFGILKKPDNNSNNINKTEKDDSMTCLLYTSPSPRDQLVSRMPSSA